MVVREESLGRKGEWVKWGRECLWINGVKWIVNEEEEGEVVQAERRAGFGEGTEGEKREGEMSREAEKGE